MFIPRVSGRNPSSQEEKNAKKGVTVNLSFLVDVSSVNQGFAVGLVEKCLFLIINCKTCLV